MVPVLSEPAPGVAKIYAHHETKAGAEVLLSNKARELWHRNYVLQWILTLWQAFNNTGGCNGDSISTGRNHLLTELVMEIKSGNLRRCEALGLTDNEIRLLNSLTIEDLHYLSQSPVSIITCQIHRENLRLLLTRAKEVHRQIR